MFKFLFCLFILFVAFNLCLANDCSSQLDGGLCYGNEDKYGFDVDLGKCSHFVYGGCGGNDNKYDSLEACIAACGN